MKSKTTILLLILALALCVTACGAGEVKRPIDCPGTTWTCNEAEFVFSVSNEKQISNAHVVDENGNDVEVTISFSTIEEAKATVSSIDGSALYFSGVCTFKHNSFTLIVTDKYDPKFSYLPIMLSFSKS
jgi:hypothetical protein